MPSFQQSPPAAEALPTAALRLPPLPDGLVGVRVRRSTRRRKTVSARLEAGEIVVFLPCGLSTSQEQEWVNRMVERVVTKRARPARSDEELARRADEIATRYLDVPAGCELRASSVRWVTNMNHRWGSCSVDTGAIRLSDRLRQMPDWVVGYVLAHELAHLKYAGHGPKFWALVKHYPQAERGGGYLDGWSAARSSTPGS